MCVCVYTCTQVHINLFHIVQSMAYIIIIMYIKTHVSLVTSLGGLGMKLETCDNSCYKYTLYMYVLKGQQFLIGFKLITSWNRKEV